MTSQAPVNLLRECPMDVLTRSLFWVSEILNRARFFVTQKCFLFHNTPSRSPVAKIYKMKTQRRQHIPHPVFLWTPSGTRGDTGATEKEVIKERCFTIRTHCYSVPCHLSGRHWACHVLLPHGLLDPISSVVQTTACPHINDNPGSYKELCSHIRTSEIKAARIWTPPTSYLGGYYS